MHDALKEGILAYTADHAEAQIDLVIDLCTQNSYTYNPSGTRRVAEILISRLPDQFRYHETLEQKGVGDHHILRTRPSSKAVYVLGHMDTVFPPDHPFRACKSEGEWLTGPGAGDMKGGLAVMVYALRALGHLGILDGLDVTLILTADEEIGAVSSRAIYEKEIPNATACLVTECAGPAGEVVMSRNGKAGLRLCCSGKDQHVSSVSKDKKSAIVEMAHKVLALESLNTSLPGVTVNVGKIEGGLGPCTVPAEARCLIDVRWSEERYYKIALDRISEIVKAPVCTGCTCEVTVLNHRPAMPATDEATALYRKVERLAGSIGIEVGREHRRGTSDANFFGSAGIPTVDGLGPVCLDDHTPNERIHIPTLRTRAALLAALLSEIAQRR
jgi:glutamate carboxypeptidase